MLQIRVVLDTLHLICYYLYHIVFDLRVIAVYLLLHDVIAVLVKKIIDDGDFPVGFRLGRHPRTVNYDARVKYLLFYLLPEIVGDAADKGAL